jgi:hypothetical protein
MWLSSRRRNGGRIIAAQDLALNLHCHQKSIMKQPIDSECRMHCNAEERKKHIVDGCTFAPSKYTNRHSKVAGYILWKMGCVNTWGYRLLTGTVNIYLRRSEMSTVPLLCGMYLLSLIKQY